MGYPLHPLLLKFLFQILSSTNFEISLFLFQFVADSPLMVSPKMQGCEVAFNQICL